MRTRGRWLLGKLLVSADPWKCWTAWRQVEPFSWEVTETALAIHFGPGGQPFHSGFDPRTPPNPPPLPSLHQWWPAHKPLRVECWPHPPPFQVPRSLNSSGMSLEQPSNSKEPFTRLQQKPPGRKLAWRKVRHIGSSNSCIQEGFCHLRAFTMDV